jgi:hypothetical protein
MNSFCDFSILILEGFKAVLRFTAMVASRLSLSEEVTDILPRLEVIMFREREYNAMITKCFFIISFLIY